MIYELRIYETVPGKLPQLHERFANHTVGFLKKHGVHLVGFWTDEIGISNRLTWMVAFENLADREKKWGAFQVDPGWIKARADSEVGGPLVTRTTSTIMRPAPYSPLQ